MKEFNKKDAKFYGNMFSKLNKLQLNANFQESETDRGPCFCRCCSPPITIHCYSHRRVIPIKMLSCFEKQMQPKHGKQEVFTSKNRTKVSVGKKLKNDILPEIEKATRYFMIESSFSSFHQFFFCG